MHDDNKGISDIQTHSRGELFPYFIEVRETYKHHIGNGDKSLQERLIAGVIWLKSNDDFCVQVGHYGPDDDIAMAHCSAQRRAKEIIEREKRLTNIRRILNDCNRSSHYCQTCVSRVRW